MKLLAVAVSVSVLLSGVAVASVVASSRQSPHPKHADPSDRLEISDEADQAGVHGGSIVRFHQAGGCPLTSVAGLPGNWTHGDYVSTVAATADTALIVEAAHSDCGKPMVSVIHRRDHDVMKTEKHGSRPAPGS